MERDAAGLEDALGRLRDWESYLARLGPFTPEAVEVVNMVQVGAALTQSALFREESRGAHYRTDFPDTVSSWQAHSLLDYSAETLHLHASLVARPEPAQSLSVC